MLEPYLAIVLGLVGGVASTLGFIFLPDWVTYSLRFLIHYNRVHSKPAQRCCSGVAVQLQCTAPEQKSDTLFLNFTPEK